MLWCLDTSAAVALISWRQLQSGEVGLQLTVSKLEDDNLLSMVKKSNGIFYQSQVQLVPLASPRLALQVCLCFIIG